MMSLTHAAFLLAVLGIPSAISVDGINWTAETFPLGTALNIVQGVVAVGGKFFYTLFKKTVADGTALYSGTDGINWTPILTTPGGLGINNADRLLYNGSAYVVPHAGGAANDTLYYSADGVAFDAIATGMLTITSGSYNSVAVKGTQFCILSPAQNLVGLSNDGLTWQEVSTAGDAFPTFSGKMIATSTHYLLLDIVGTNGIQISPNGINWRNFDLPITTTWGTMVVNAADEVLLTTSDGSTRYVIITGL